LISRANNNAQESEQKSKEAEEQLAVAKELKIKEAGNANSINK